MALKSPLPALPELMCSPGALTAGYLRELLPADADASLLASVGIPVARLHTDPHYRVPLYQAWRLLALTLAQAGDPLLAVRQARALSLKAFPWLGMSVLASTTLAEGLRRLIALEPLIWDAGHIALQLPADPAGEARLVWQALLPTPPAVIELALAGWVLLGPALWQIGEGDYHLGFRHGARAPLADCSAAFGCPVRFDCADNALHFPAAWLTRELRYADPGAGALILREAQRQLALAPLELNLENHLRAHCFRALPGELPDAAALATALGIPHRHLRQLMTQHGINLRDLQDRVREEAALYWATMTECELADLALACGYSEQSAFQRAFRRWTGETPGAWQAKQREPARKVLSIDPFFA